MTNFFNFLYNTYHKALATIVRKKHDIRISKTMEDYKINFDLDTKIAWNRHKLREQFEMYKKIENYYALIFAYIGLLGFGVFDIFNNICFVFSYECFVFNFFVLVFLLFVILSFVYFWKVLQLNELKFDNRPSQIYKGSINILTEKYKNESKKEINQRCLKAYLVKLEEYVDFNHVLYIKKKSNVKHMVFNIIFCFLLYIPLLTYTKMSEVDDSKSIPDEVLIENLVNKHLITKFSEYEKTLTKKELNTNSKLREIVKEEIKSYFSENDILNIKQKKK